MKTTEFNRNYELDRQSRGIKATSKRAAAEYPVTLTADGKPFNHSVVYFFFDVSRGEVRATDHLRRIDGEHLGSMGLRIVAISKLHASKDRAIEDAQKHCLDEIEKFKTKIRDFEQLKSPQARTTKFILMARG